MTLPTVVVCDAAEKSKQIASLVKSQPNLELVQIVTRQAAREQIASLSPKIVWLELAPEPSQAIALLGDLKGHHPASYFLVSYETLQADFVKATMQLGALDYLDAKSWHEQLPQAINRVLEKEKTLVREVKSPPVQTLLSSQPSAQTVDRPPSEIAAFEQAGTGEKEDEVALETRWPNWVLPALTLILVIVFVVLQFAR